jgi:hypothetical protein
MALVAETYPSGVIGQTLWWLQRFRSDFHGDVPQQIHNHEIANDGSPQWHPDFARWLTAREVIDTPRPEVATPENRLRTTRALRRLRKTAVREFEVVYRIMVVGSSIEEVTIWLNERAERNGVPLPPNRSVYYSEKDTSCILFSGVDKMRDWWQQA